MIKGISPVIATVILISIAFVAGIAIYWWATNFSTQFPSGDQDDPYEINVDPLNWTSGEMLIRNVDARDMPAQEFYIAQDPSKTCSVPALSAGESYNCTFGSGLSGSLTFAAKKVDEVTLYHE